MTAHGIELESLVIQQFCRKWKIRELSVFGSILREDFRPDSDIDFLVDYEADAEWDLFDSLRMQDELETLLGRPVDILDRFALDYEANRYIQETVLSDAKTVYDSR